MRLESTMTMRVNYTFTAVDTYDLAKVLYHKLGIATIEEIYRRIKLGVFPEKLLCQTVKQYELGRVQKKHNLVPKVLREEFATLISGTAVTPTFQANKIVLGTDATAVSVDDTTLGNETIRQDFSDRSAIGTQAFLDKFFGSIDVGGQTFQEAGVLVDGAASVGGAGYLLSHVNFNETLTSTESLTVNVTISINNG